MLRVKVCCAINILLTKIKNKKNQGRGAVLNSTNI